MEVFLSQAPEYPATGAEQWASAEDTGLPVGTVYLLTGAGLIGVALAGLVGVGVTFVR
jgi:hypothetical protein